MKAVRNQAFLDLWNENFTQLETPGYMLRATGMACLPLTWAAMAFFKYKRF